MSLQQEDTVEAGCRLFLAGAKHYKYKYVCDFKTLDAIVNSIVAASDEAETDKAESDRKVSRQLAEYILDPSSDYMAYLRLQYPEVKAEWDRLEPRIKAEVEYISKSKWDFE